MERHPAAEQEWRPHRFRPRPRLLPPPPLAANSVAEVSADSVAAADSVGVGGFGGGGGFDGGSDGPSDLETRVMIARASAALSTLDKNPKSLAILKKLEEPMTLHFPAEAPLNDVLKHIRDASKGSDGKKIAIYVDPLGLQEADKTLTSPVTIDLEDTPLRLSLRLMLKQLGLAYCVRDGVLMISSLQGIEQELKEAQAEQMGLNPEKFPPGMMRGMGGMGGMGGGGMGGMGRRYG